jgi:hypothetical protein
MEIAYETGGYICWTDCPFGMAANVGSKGCEKCEFFVSNDQEGQVVNCKNPNRLRSHEDQGEE